MKFDEAINVILKNEGEYVNDPDDNGGETNYGISKQAYPDEDIKNMTKKRASEIYKRDYWDAGHVEYLPDEFRLMYFDMCINHGIKRAVKIIQKATCVEVDGILGPVTINAMQDTTTDNIRDSRIAYYVNITQKDKRQKRFLNGWIKRAYSV